MAYRELELTLLSARDLKNVNLFMRMDVYAVASISGDPKTRQCTPTDTSGGSNPSWNATLRFSVPPSSTEAGGGWLHVLLRSERALGDRDIGEVVIPLADLLAGKDGPGPQPPRFASYQVRTVHRGEPRGVLNVSYRLGPGVTPAERTNSNVPFLPRQALPSWKDPLQIVRFQVNNMGAPAPQADRSKPTPFYVPPWSNATTPGKTDHSRPIVFPQRGTHAPGLPDISPPQLDHNMNPIPQQPFKPQNQPPPLWNNKEAPAHGKSNNGHVPAVNNLPGRGKMTSSVEYLNKINFDDKLKTGNLVVLEFTAPWSEPCKFMKPKVEKLANEKKDKTVFYALDIREFKELAERLDVEALPTFMLVHNYNLKARVIGVDEDELNNAIDSTNQKISSSP